jgi:YesN/AraC family two-component response regulator
MRRTSYQRGAVFANIQPYEINGMAVTARSRTMIGKRMSRKLKARIMWIDLTVSVKQSELPSLFSQEFDIIQPHKGSSPEMEIQRQNPELLLFDFDFPERPGLRLLEMTKKQFSRIPILMSTTQHSEALAVWAFRARIWDYLVKPVPESDLVRCLAAFQSLLELSPKRERYRDICGKTSPLPEENNVAPRSTTPAELMPALAYIEQNFRERVTSAMVSNTCHMDSFQFSRAFRSAFGITFKEYLLRVRIKEACRLLEKPNIAVTEVAYLSGFNDPSYFSRVFKRFAGVSPSVYVSSSDHRAMLGDDRLSLIL